MKQEEIILLNYKDILRTENDHGIYKDVKKIIEDSKYDLEKFIGKLLADINSKNTFLKKYVENKVKYDFMKAAHGIVKHEIKNIYAEKNEGIYMLLRNFNNYFTLNYDSFLYLLLLNFKLSDTDDKTAIAIQSSLKFMEEDMNETQSNIYSGIKQARQNGTLNINAGNDSNTVSKPMSELTKTHFVAEIKTYSKSQNKNWKASDIERVVKSILEEERKNNLLKKVDDGSQLSLFGGTPEFVFDIKKETQNLFFLHGAFHIYRDGKKEKKITQTSDKALYDRLEEIINSEERELSKLSGTLVIIGCSLSDNDSHIYEQINSSEVNTIYISSKKTSKKTDYEKAEKIFNNKKIVLFDRETITYELQSIDDSKLNEVTI